jgi:SHS2 domain-containing protein
VARYLGSYYFLIRGVIRYKIMDSNSLNYEIIDHTADMGIRVKGNDLKSLFINAARAMIDLMVTGDFAGEKIVRDSVIKGEDFPDLMVKWLGEILYLFDGEKLIVHSIEITSITPVQVQSRLALTSFEEAHHKVLREIKAVTYHQISVAKINQGWEARVIFDI